MTLSDVQIKQSNNLHLIRFLAAVGVLFHHSFILSSGNLSKEWLAVLTKSQLTFGSLCVSIFFLAGGYLISGSAQKSRGFIPFIRRRLLRIIPPLAAVNITVIIVCGFFSALPLREYYCQAGTWRYLLNSVLILVHNLPGVFLDNIYTSTVNGALWTLPVEFICYILCWLIYRIFSFEKKRFAWFIPIAGAGFASAIVLKNRIPFLSAVILPCMFFCIGMAARVYREHIVMRGMFFAAACAVLLIFCAAGAGRIGLVLTLPYIIMYLSYAVPQVHKALGTLGNYSYGMYLCGFPLQQMIISRYGGTMNSYLNFCIAVPLAVAGGVMVYHGIESRL